VPGPVLLLKLLPAAWSHRQWSQWRPPGLTSLPLTCSCRCVHGAPVLEGFETKLD
jgi:hypothetical protein